MLAIWRSCLEKNSGTEFCCISPLKRMLSQVRNLDEVKFYPGKLLQSIVHIYINLKEESSFVSAIPRDGRSYHPALFKDTAAKIRKLYVPEDVIADLLKVWSFLCSLVFTFIPKNSCAIILSTIYLSPKNLGIKFELIWATEKLGTKSSKNERFSTEPSVVYLP